MADDELETAFTVAVKWGKEVYTVNLPQQATLGDLKRDLEIQTQVLVKKQKLLGVPRKAGDETPFANLKIKPGKKLMMMGTREADALRPLTEAELEALRPADDLDMPDDCELEVKDQQVVKDKIARAVQRYTPKKLNDFVPGKKTLVLDVDYTLFDHRTVASNAGQLRRPYLHEFLTAVHEYYNIVIWSATNMRWIDAKLAGIGVTGHTGYKICYQYCHYAMITVKSPKYGVFNTKPLGVIWGQFPDICTPQNTIMFDDLGRNGIANPDNLLKIKPCRNLLETASTDRELKDLAVYLVAIKDEPDLRVLDFGRWRSYLRHNGLGDRLK